MARVFLMILLVAVVVSAGSAAPAPRERLLMDFGWRFKLGDPPDAGQVFAYPEVRDLAKADPGDAAEEARLAESSPNPVAANLGGGVSFVQPDCNDRGWRQIDLPHDWVVELGFDPNGNMSHGYKAIRHANGTDVGWYRRSFDLPAQEKGKTVWIEFDGVFRNCLVWLNGHCLGRNVSGYSSFSYDLGRYAHFGGKNVLVVRVDASRTEGWFYEGAGIYRHVWLVKTDPVHIAHWGTYVTSAVAGPDAQVSVQTQLRNDSNRAVTCTLVSTLTGANGKAIARAEQASIAIEPGKDQAVTQKLAVRNAKLWSIESPNLYHLVSTVKQQRSTIDAYETPFGIRTIRFDPDHGFFLNGKRVEIQGVCCHQDHAGVGAALPDRIQYYRIEKLKEMGCNAYRTSHNDPTPELLEACDRLGMLVMDEHRKMGASPEILGQLERLIRRDRNHPSVILWSLGNEESGIQASEVGAQVAATMRDVVRRLDPTRPVTVAMNGGWGRGFSTVVDVQGCNYFRSGKIDTYHQTHPLQPIFGSEEASTVSTRGIYANDREKGYVSAYDVNRPQWGSTAEKWWTYFASRPFLAGAFVWTGFDYRGEPTPYSWPCINSHFGIMDTCGFPKDNYYYYQAWWTEKPVLHLFPHWNWPGKEGQEIAVWCDSNCEAVELFLNGESLGKQTMPVNSHLEWKVPYAPGTLLAKGYRGSQEMAQVKVETTGAAARIKLLPDRSAIQADGEDVSMVTVEVVDAQGRVVPAAENEVSFAIEGGKILGVGSGDPSSHEPDKAGQRKVFNGLAQVIVQSMKKPGDIMLSATSPGLQPADVKIQAVRCVLRPAVP